MHYFFGFRPDQRYTLYLSVRDGCAAVQVFRRGRWEGAQGLRSALRNNITPWATESGHTLIGGEGKGLPGIEASENSLIRFFQTPSGNSARRSTRHWRQMSKPSATGPSMTLSTAVRAALMSKAIARDRARIWCGSGMTEDSLARAGRPDKAAGGQGCSTNHLVLGFP